eukprot:CAMPEP_0167807532 /NCGR_PEP_ID=MMETSP0111_2-20121227/22605_2 /TAXON_ID=91324 /ORGANISM="Lotharella globosa, Strain CCCM811" /LENGTH=109 /DNA_ID=CAMNT_0007705445 /DNA_START=422 /DNA_END=748 /DNA_ORIENTATION=-
MARIYGRNPRNLARLRNEGSNGLTIAKDEQLAEEARQGPGRGPWGIQHFVGKAGDVVIVNYLTAHSVAPNRSPNIRHAVYFRVHTSLCGEGEFWTRYRPVALALPWHDW